MELLVPMVFKHISGIRGEWIFCGEEMCSLAHTWKMVFTAAPGRAPAASRLCEEAHGSGPSCGGGGGCLQHRAELRGAASEGRASFSPRSAFLLSGAWSGFYPCRCWSRAQLTGLGVTPALPNFCALLGVSLIVTSVCTGNP